MVGESRLVVSFVLIEVPMEIFENTLHILDLAGLHEVKIVQEGIFVQEAITLKIARMAFESLSVGFAAVLPEFYEGVQSVVGYSSGNRLSIAKIGSYC
jgi:hypothetical protein